MALRTTWGASNRVVTSDLRTTYERVFVPADESDVFVAETGLGCAYWKYTRTRTKTYKYVGLSHAAALQCASALNKLYNRVVFPWLWNDQDCIWWRNQGVNKETVRYMCGEATPNHVAGDDWEVDVSVNEVITIPWRTEAGKAHDFIPGLWDEFENNPDIRTNAFMGYDPQGTTRQDFDYDED